MMYLTSAVVVARGKGREGEEKEEIMHMCGVVRVKYIGMGLECGMEVCGEIFGLLLIGSGPRPVTSPQGRGDVMESEQPFSGCP